MVPTVNGRPVSKTIGTRKGPDRPPCDSKNSSTDSEGSGGVLTLVTESGYDGCKYVRPLNASESFPSQPLSHPVLVLSSLFGPTV